MEHVINDYIGIRSPEAAAYEQERAGFACFRTREETIEYMATLPAENEAVQIFPADAVPLKTKMEEVDFNGHQMFVFNPDSDVDTTIIWIHGGAYCHHLVPPQWAFADEVAYLTGARLLLPLYPLAPVHTYEESYELIEALYRSVMEEKPGGRIALMGDSSGGGMSLGFCQIMPELGLPQPDALILISPWIDLTMENPDEAAYEAEDPSLDRIALRVNAESWAGGTDLRDPKISPIFGDMSMLRNAYIYVGTREIFYPDDVALYEKIKAAGVETYLFTGYGCNHVFATSPIPEGDWARLLIKKQALGEGAY